jgi:predicted nicotinamide N-methyase
MELESESDPTEYHNHTEILTIPFPTFSLSIQQYNFHPLNANQVWPGSLHFAGWLESHWEWVEGKTVLELGAGCGALAIWLRKKGVRVTTCDYCDEEIEGNIRENCRLNEVETLPHIPHTWGTPFPSSQLSSFSLILASDILIYVSQYPALVNTLQQLLSSGAHMLLSNRRRIDSEAHFLKLCEEGGLETTHLGAKVFHIRNRPVET